jgi:hypothetical protein
MDRAWPFFEGFLASPITWGVVTLLALALALSGKLSMSAATYITWVAFGTAVFGVYRAEGIIKIDPLLRFLILGCVAFGFAACIVRLNRWMVSPKTPVAEVGVKHEAETPKPGAPLIFVKGYGIKQPDIVWANFSCEDLVPYRNDYLIVLVSRVTNRMVDLQIDTDIARSEPFTIPPAGDLEIQMQVPQRFFTKSAQLNSGQISIDFAVLLAPKNADLSKITSVRSIHDIGGLELAANGVAGGEIKRLLSKKPQPKTTVIGTNEFTNLRATDGGVGILTWGPTNNRFTNADVSGNALNIVSLSPDVNPEEALKILQPMIESYMKTHVGQRPTSDWINKRLRAQKQNFRVDGGKKEKPD